MSGDNIKLLPINKSQSPNPTDLEFMYTLFQPKNKVAIKNGVSIFKYALLGGIIFTLLSLPPILSLVNMYCKDNIIYTKIILMIIFIITFFIAQKLLFKS